MYNGSQYEQQLPLIGHRKQLVLFKNSSVIQLPPSESVSGELVVLFWMVSWC